MGSAAARRRTTAFLHEFVRFGVKQAWACLFGGAMLALLLGIHRWYPARAALARYDFLTVAAVAIQAAMPLRVGLLLVTFFIWVAENIGTFAQAWVYPHQATGWSPVGTAKTGAW